MKIHWNRLVQFQREGSSNSRFTCLTYLTVLLFAFQPTPGMGQPNPNDPIQQRLEELKKVKSMLSDLGVKTLQNHIYPRAVASGEGLNFYVYREKEFDESEAKYLGRIPQLTSMSLESSFAREAIRSFKPDNEIDTLDPAGGASVERIVKTFPKLKALYLDSPGPGNEFRLRPLAKLTQLTRLQFSPWGASLTDVDAILRNISECEDLESIGIKGKFSNSAFQELQNFPHLQSLYMTGRCKGENLDGIAPALEATQLKSLHIKLTHRDPEKDLSIPELGNVSHLEQVILFGFRGDDLSGLDGAKNLKLLELHCGREDSLCRVPADLSTLASNESLEEISFTNDRSYAGLTRQHLGELRRFPSLKVARFGLLTTAEVETDELLIRDDELQALAEMKDLESVDLTAQKLITVEGLRHLTGLKKLKHLSLIDTELDDDAMKIVAQIPSLERISLYRTGVTEAGIQTLLGMPHLQRIEGAISDPQRENEINVELRKRRAGTK